MQVHTQIAFRIGNEGAGNITHRRARGWRCHAAMLAGEILHYKQDADFSRGVVRGVAGALKRGMLQAPPEFEVIPGSA